MVTSINEDFIIKVCDVRNKEFHYFSAVQFKQNPGK